MPVTAHHVFNYPDGRFHHFGAEFGEQAVVNSNLPSLLGGNIAFQQLPADIGAVFAFEPGEKFIGDTVRGVTAFSITLDILPEPEAENHQSACACATDLAFSHSASKARAQSERMLLGEAKILRESGKYGLRAMKIYTIQLLGFFNMCHNILPFNGQRVVQYHVAMLVRRGEPGAVIPLEAPVALFSLHAAGFKLLKAAVVGVC